MTWLAVHPDNTEDARLPDEEGAPVFTIGFWPPREDVRIRALLPALFTPSTLDPMKDQDAFVREVGLHFSALREAAKWGVRGWSGAAQEAKTITVKVDGREHVALSDESIEVLHRGGLLASAGLRAIVFNRLTEDQKKSYASALSSNSSSTSTGATPATPSAVLPENPTAPFPVGTVPLLTVAPTT